METRYFEGLIALLGSAFPKKCSSCGHVYETPRQFFEETLDMPRKRASLRMVIDDGVTIVEAFRNCRCGSTLMDEFGCRRDQAEAGRQRRIAFDKMLTLLLSRNVSEAVARAEIVDFLHGKPNRLEILLSDDIDFLP